MKTMIPGMWVTVPKKRINSAPEWPASLTQDWSASGQKPDTLLVHQGGHVSQFFDEWQFVSRGPDIFPKEKKCFQHFQIHCVTGAFLIVAQIPWWWSPGFMIHTSAARARNQDFSDSICLDTYMKKCRLLLWLRRGFLVDEAATWKFVDVCQVDSANFVSQEADAIPIHGVTMSHDIMWFCIFACFRFDRAFW